MHIRQGIGFIFHGRAHGSYLRIDRSGGRWGQGSWWVEGAYKENTEEMYATQQAHVDRERWPEKQKIGGYSARKLKNYIGV